MTNCLCNWAPGHLNAQPFAWSLHFLGVFASQEPIRLFEAKKFREDLPRGDCCQATPGHASEISDHEASESGRPVNGQAISAMARATRLPGKKNPTVSWLDFRQIRHPALAPHKKCLKPRYIPSSLLLFSARSILLRLVGCGLLRAITQAAKGFNFPPTCLCHLDLVGARQCFHICCQVSLHVPSAWLSLSTSQPLAALAAWLCPALFPPIDQGSGPCNNSQVMSVPRNLAARPVHQGSSNVVGFLGDVCQL